MMHQIEQQSRKKVLHEAVFEMRKQKYVYINPLTILCTIFVVCNGRYLELVCTDGAEALRYLKTDLAECVDHTDQEQSEEVGKEIQRLLVVLMINYY